MASKSQRRAQKSRLKQKQKKKRERREKRKERSLEAPGSFAERQGRRLARQMPRAWPGELAEDVAVFDAGLRKTLAPEIAAQAEAVLEALQLADTSRYEEALERVASIPRSSPYSEWRLFLRGLVAWAADNDLEAAQASWSRLDRSRRPGRIATALATAHRPDLESIRLSDENEDEAAGDAGPLDSALLYGARLVYRTRIERKAIAQALHGALRPEEDEELLIGPEKIAWLRQFAAGFERLEPALVQALQQAALERAYGQRYSDLFTMAIRAFPGPPHDRKNRLLTFFFFLDSKESRAEESLSQYLKADLPANQAIPIRLRNALISEAHVKEARSSMASSGTTIFDLFQRPSNSRAMQHLEKAIAAYPQNAEAHREYTQLLESEAEEASSARERESLLNKQVGAMRAWSKAIPDDAAPRLWLVDHFQENEDLEAARPHVEWLSSVRHDNPLVRAAPWKWRLLEASRLCRRKAQVAQARQSLAEAEAIWPKWLGRDWLAYLNAALSLRLGDNEAFQQQRVALAEASGRKLDGLTDAVMMLAAAQFMRVPSTQVKPLRPPIDAAAARPHDVPWEELVDVGNFFWDLNRCKLKYPAYRRHGSKLAAELSDRLNDNGRQVARALNNDRCQNAMLWLSTHRFGQDRYSCEAPRVVQAASAEHPKLAAATVNAALAAAYVWNAPPLDETLEYLRASAADADSFYRYWFVSIADEFEERASTSRGPFAMLEAFMSSMGRADGAASEEAFGPVDFDPDCDCADCRAARQAAGYDY